MRGEALGNQCMTWITWPHLQSTRTTEVSREWRVHHFIWRLSPCPTGMCIVWRVRSPIVDESSNGETSCSNSSLWTKSVNSRVHLHIADMSRPEDGIAKLKHLEMTKGIWTMRCQLIIETRDLVIIDKQTGVRTQFS